MEERQDEIVNLLACESVSTLHKAQFEWRAVHAITVEGASFPRMEGRILSIDESQKGAVLIVHPLEAKTGMPVSSNQLKRRKRSTGSS
jgi:hypothetical protein